MLINPPPPPNPRNVHSIAGPVVSRDHRLIQQTSMNLLALTHSPLTHSLFVCGHIKVCCLITLLPTDAGALLLVLLLQYK